MTANPFAALLAKIGRYSHDCDEPHLVPEPDGKWLDRDEVLAALAAAVPADLAEAVEVLRGLLIAADGDSYGDYFNAIEAGHAFLAKLENRHE